MMISNVTKLNSNRLLRKEGSTKSRSKRFSKAWREQLVLKFTIKRPNGTSLNHKLEVIKTIWHLNSRLLKLLWRKKRKDCRADRAAQTSLIWILTTEGTPQRFCICSRSVRIQARPTLASCASNLASGAIWIGINRQRKKERKEWVVLSQCGNIYQVLKTKYLRPFLLSKRREEEEQGVINRILLPLRTALTEQMDLTSTNSEMLTWASLESW